MNLVLRNLTYIGRRRWPIRIALLFIGIALTATLQLLTPDVVLAQVDTVWVRKVAFSPFQFWASVAVDVEVDSNGIIYVGGGSFFSGDGNALGLAKIDSSGDTLWVRRLTYAGPAGSLYHMNMDVAGSILMVLEDNRIAKYYPSGDTAWVRVFASPDFTTLQITSDLHSNVFAADGGSRVARYSSSGDSLWLRNLPLQGYPMALEADTSGCLLVAAQGELLGNFNFLLTKFSPIGDTIWTQTFDGSAHSSDRPEALDVTQDGSAYLTGWSRSAGTGLDYTTIKYTPNGAVAWTRLFDGASHFTDSATCIEVDDSGNVYVTGASWLTDYDYLTIKYSPAGDTLWTARFNSGNDIDDHPTAMRLDDAGNVYITGVSNSASQAIAVHTLKYSPAGQQLWEIAHPIDKDASAEIALGGAHEVYLAVSLIVEHDFELVRYSDADEDGDGAIDLYDNCLGMPNPAQANSDFDSLGDSCDNCRAISNQNQGVAVSLSGDVNASGQLTSADIIALVNYIFKGGASPMPCIASGDPNCSGTVTSADIIVLVNHIFKGFPPPCDICEAVGLGWTCP